jgi:hypothetical protein
MSGVQFEDEGKPKPKPTPVDQEAEFDDDEDEEVYVEKEVLALQYVLKDVLIFPDDHDVYHALKSF